MILGATVALLLMSIGATAVEPSSGESIEEPARTSTPTRTLLAQLLVREQIIVRVPVRIRRAVPPAPNATQIEWKEGKGPKCVAAKSIIGASLLGRNSVDLILRGNSRIRAKLEHCPALDYYYGFYLSPQADGKICADRDMIRSRMGGTCEIERFRTLKPVARD